jgi:hypothetical protein
MEEGKIVILDPVAKPKLNSVGINPRPQSVAGLRVAMVDNTKPNFNLFLDTVEERLVNDYRVASVVRYQKPGRTEPLNPQLITEIKLKCDIAITGLGD